MPIMDGFESTKKILQLFNENPQRSAGLKCNIVALTAYTDKKTVERCLSIGMK